MFEGNENIRSAEKKEALGERETYALVMVKPHAMRESVDTVIMDLFSGGFEKHLPYLKLSEETKRVLVDLKVLSSEYRDLRDERYSRILDILYQKEEGKPQHSIIKEEYTGPCLFIILSSSLTADVCYGGLQALKGKEQLLNDFGEIIDEGNGIRGVMIQPRKMMDLDHLNEADIKIITQNVVHVADRENEAASVIRILLSPTEVERLGTLAPGFKKFMNKNAPVSII
ncbi:MAG TPA: hypothetical protein PLI45_04620 [Candidatus Woesebacteria bacterium]|nr:hypothetical protein [Candidatus Woesebacteria bacterium]